MADYCGIKIFDKVIIVEKTWNEESTYNWKGRTVNQGYVVDYGNTKMLETAKCWAEWTKYNEKLYTEWREFTQQHSSWQCGHEVWDSPENKKTADCIIDEYHKSAQKQEGIIHEYDNGTFEIILDEAAGSSSQGGKLSFWNCIIKASDGKTFLIGISSDLLLHLMMKNTFVNGACQSKIWLGRIKGKSVGAFTENMDEFIQSKEDEKLRQQAAAGNSKYVPGDIVGNYNNRYIYLGTFYNYLMQERYRYYSKERYIYYTKPKIMHLFSDLTDGTFKEVAYPTYNYTKPKYTVYGHVDLTKSAFEYIKEYFEQEINNDAEYPRNRLFTKILLYSFAETKDADRSEMKRKINEAVAEYLKKHYIDIEFYDEEEYNKNEEKYRD